MADNNSEHQALVDKLHSIISDEHVQRSAWLLAKANRDAAGMKAAIETLKAHRARFHTHHHQLKTLEKDHKTPTTLPPRLHDAEISHMEGSLLDVHTGRHIESRAHRMWKNRQQ